MELKQSSHSQLETWTHCPMAWWLTKVQRAPQLQAAWFVQGTAAHAAIEHWEREGRTSDSAAVAVYHDEYEKEIAKSLELEPDIDRWLRGGRKSAAKDIDDRKALGASQVEWYIDMARQSDYKIWTTPSGEPALELGFELELGGVQIRGYIDAVWEWPTGQIEPVDLKTGAKVKSARQLGLYKVALEQLYGITVTHGRYVMLKQQKTLPADLSRYTHKYLSQLYAAQARGVAANAIIPNVGDGCFTCSVKESCMEYNIFLSRT